MARKYPGAKGARSSRAQEASKEMVATIFQRLGLASKRSFTTLLFGGDWVVGAVDVCGQIGGSFG